MSAPRPRVVIVDTGSGNLRSVEKAVVAAGGDAEVSCDADAVKAADQVVVPGQGAFGGCMSGLGREGGALREAVLEAIRAGKPYLGICIGMQVLLEGSDEEPGCAGLGLIPGRVVRFAPPPPLKVPHMGWNGCRRGPAGGSAVLGDMAEGTHFYFVHSYYPAPARASDVALWTDYGADFCAAVARDNLFACQFHPEKSQSAGLGLIRRFLAA